MVYNMQILYLIILVCMLHNIICIHTAWALFEDLLSFRILSAAGPPGQTLCLFPFSRSCCFLCCSSCTLSQQQLPATGYRPSMGSSRRVFSCLIFSRSNQMVNIQKNMEITIFDGKTHYLDGHIQCLCNTACGTPAALSTALQSAKGLSEASLA